MMVKGFVKTRILSVILTGAMLLQSVPFSVNVKAETPDTPTEYADEVPDELIVEDTDPLVEGDIDQPDEYEEVDGESPDLSYENGIENPDVYAESDLPDEGYFSENGEPAVEEGISSEVERQEEIPEEDFTDSGESAPADEDDEELQYSLRTASSPRKDTESDDNGIQIVDVEQGTGSASSTWGSDFMQFPKAKQKIEELIEIGSLSSHVCVAVIDSGVNSSHELFQGRISDKSRSFINEDPSDFEDRNFVGHGSHVAGIIAQNTTELVDLMILQTLDENGRGTIDNTVSAINYAVQNGASIINLSLGASKDAFRSENEYDEAVEKLSTAISNAADNGCLVVVPAGNEGADVSERGTIPAMCYDSLTIGALTENSTVSELSNYGWGVDFYAPGEEICSASNISDDYQYLSGTSMAAAFAVGFFADIKSLQPGVSGRGLVDCAETGAIWIEKYRQKRSYVFSDELLESVMHYGETYSHPEILEVRNYENDEELGIYNEIDYYVSLAGLIYLYRREENDPEFEKVAEFQASTSNGYYLDKNLEPGCVYYYYIEAADESRYENAQSNIMRQRSEHFYTDFIEMQHLFYVGESHELLHIIDNRENLTFYSENEELLDLRIEKHEGYDSLTVYGKNEGTTVVHVKTKDDASFEQTYNITVRSKEKCGAGAFWERCEDSEGVTLKITGSGAIYDYMWPVDVPWYDRSGQITAIFVGDEITRIGNSAFNGLVNLKKVEGMKGVREIGSYAFSYAEISDLLIPSTVETIEEEAFYQAKIHNFKIAEDNPYFVIRDDVLYNKDLTELKFCSPLKSGSVVIPGTVRKIENYAFYDCSISEVIFPDGIEELCSLQKCDNLKRVYIPSSVKSIPSGAFIDCYNLKNIELPDGLETIGNCAFNGSGLTDIYLPDTVSVIEIGAFSGCKSLKSIRLSKNLQDIADAFDGCDAITDVVFPGFTSDLMKINGYSDSTVLQKAKTHIEISGQLEQITWNISGDSGDLTLTISGSGDMPDFPLPTSIPWYNGIQEITNVIVEEGVSYIGRYSFYQHSNLRSVLLPPSVQNYGASAFRGDPELKTFAFSDQDGNKLVRISPDYLVATYNEGFTFDPDLVVTSSDGSELHKGSDYNVQYSVIVGEGTKDYSGLISIQFLNDYSFIGTATLPFAVVSKHMKGESGNTIKTLELSQLSFVYNGLVQKPRITVKNANGELLANGIDYNLEFKDSSSKKAGDYSVTAKGINAFIGSSATMKYKITKRKIGNGVEIIGIENKTYTGKKIEQKLKLRIGGDVLREGIDYSVSYKKNVNVGEATIVISGKGSLSGSTEKTFVIETRNIANLLPNLLSERKYQGKAIHPKPTLKYNSIELKKGKDYIIDYGKNTNIGPRMGSLTFTGRGNWSGSKTVYFNIVKCPISDVKIDNLQDKTFNGRIVSQALILTHNGRRLVKGKDYIIKSRLKKNSIGSVSITVIGQNCYKGSRIVHFYINKAEQPMSARCIRPAKVKWKNVRVNNRYVEYSKIITIKKSIGKIRFSRYIGSRYLDINRNGRIRVKKGTMKGTFRMYVNITAEGNKYYKPKTVRVLVKVQVK